MTRPREDDSVTTVDRRLRAGALAFVLAAGMSIPVLFSVHPATDPGHSREFALAANSFSYRLGWSLQAYAVVPVILGMFALYAAIADTAGRRWGMAGLVLTVGGAGLLLPGIGFVLVVMPAAGVVISSGGGPDVVRVLDQVYSEPALIPVFLGGLLYHVGLVAMGVAVWRSGAMTRRAALLLAAAGVVGLPAALDVTVFQMIMPAVFAAALLALASGMWRRALPSTPGHISRPERDTVP